MNPDKFTKDDYSNLDAAFTAFRRENVDNENNLIGIINLKAKVFSNLKKYDESIDLILEKKDILDKE